jgi:hypothetical protein
MGNFTSIYKALVHDLNDPEKRGRAKLVVPAVLGRNVSGWALPVLGGSAGGSGAKVGDQVWAFFENGDLNRPTWVPTAVGSPDAVVRVVHNGTSWPSRPNAKFVEWLGPTDPPEATANDTWVNTAV